LKIKELREKYLYKFFSRRHGGFELTLAHVVRIYYQGGYWVRVKKLYLNSKDDKRVISTSQDDYGLEWFLNTYEIQSKKWIDLMFVSAEHDLNYFLSEEE
jgi:hypothetical protein